MKNAVTFFLFLCVHFAGVYHYAHASVRGEKARFSSALKLEKAQGLESATASHDCLFIVNTSLSGENLNLFNADDEDENEDIIRKHISQARYLLAFGYAFISNYRLSFPEDHLPSCEHLSCISSCKYITQRALLI